MTFLEDFDQIFAGRRDVFSEGFPNPRNPAKYTYRPVEEPLTHAALKEHLLGSIQIGIYPIMLDNAVKWFAVDIDGDKTVEVDEAFAVALPIAKQQQERFAAVGLKTYLERSRSGRGVHCWGFLEAPMAAAQVRRAIAPYVLDTVAHDMWFPAQDVVAPGKLGSLIALPFQGAALKLGHSVFLDANDQPINPRDFVAQLEYVPAEQLNNLAGQNEVVNRVRVVGADGEFSYTSGESGALKLLSPYGCRFLRHCYTDQKTLSEREWHAGLQIAAHFRHGRDFAHILSNKHPRYDEKKTNAKFDQVMSRERIGCAWIHENYPQHACAGCPMKAPHFLARKPIKELVGGQSGKSDRLGSFTGDLAKVKRLDDGTALSGLSTGFEGLDNVMRYRRNELVAIGARPSMGKTWHLVQSSVALARQNVRAFVFSAETGEGALRERYLAHAARVDSRLLRGEGHRRLTTAEWNRLEKASHELQGLPLYVDYTALDANDVMQQVEAVLLRERADLDQQFVMFFDYLQFGSRDQGESQFDQVTRLSNEFKFTAKILMNTMVIYSQLNRTAEGGEESDMTSWRGSGQLEQDMDTGVFLLGDRVEGEKAARRMAIGKQRDGLANVEIPFILNQTYGEWEYAGGSRREDKPILEMISENE